MNLRKQDTVSVLPSKKAGKSSKAKILITGAGGFLGSHICRYFGEAGHPVAAVGRFHAALDLMNAYPNLVLLGGMTLPDASFREVVTKFQPDLLIHCAGTASVKDSVEDPYKDFQRTVDVCAYTLETLRRYRPECFFVLFSSASVYGNPISLPINEECPITPISPYGFHKVMCEELVREYSLLHGLSTAIVRIFSAYGENCQKQVIHDLCRKLLLSQGNTIEVLGTGKESRDFIHGRDIAAAIDAIFRKRTRGVFNLGSGEETTIRELFPLLARGLGMNKTAAFTGHTRKGDPLFWRADISRMKTLGFKPRISLVQGTKAYCQWLLGQERASWSAVPQLHEMSVKV